MSSQVDRRPQGGNGVSWITENDRIRSATVHHIAELRRAIELVSEQPIRRMLDIGCGFGGLSRTVGDWLGVEEVHGIDVDAAVLDEARDKGVVAHHVDVSSERLPFDDGYLGLVTCFGMMDYLPFFDPLVREMQRVLEVGGYVLVSLPNLASWHNRLMLLFGYQPRDVEVSTETLVGVHPWYRTQRPTGHIHTVTASAFDELMAFHGFARQRLLGGTPRSNTAPMILRAVDRLIARSPKLARRFFYLGRKVDRAAAGNVRV